MRERKYSVICILVERRKRDKSGERCVALGGALILETALEVCKGCEHRLATCPYAMAVADCPKVRDAVLKMLRGDPEEDDVVENR